MSETIQPRQLLSLIWARIWSKRARQHVELIPEQQKRLEFSDICPEWNKKFNGLEHDSRLDICNSQYCVIGEAYGFRDNIVDNYACGECYWFSRADGFIHAESNESDRPGIIESFVQHWNECHVM